MAKYRFLSLTKDLSPCLQSLSPLGTKPKQFTNFDTLTTKSHIPEEIVAGEKNYIFVDFFLFKARRNYESGGMRTSVKLEG